MISSYISVVQTDSRAIGDRPRRRVHQSYKHVFQTYSISSESDCQARGAQEQSCGTPMFAKLSPQNRAWLRLLEVSAVRYLCPASNRSGRVGVPRRGLLPASQASDEVTRGNTPRSTHACPA